MKNKHVDTNIAFRKKFNFKSFPANIFDDHIKKSIPLINEFHFPQGVAATCTYNKRVIVFFFGRAGSPATSLRTDPLSVDTAPPQLES